MSREHSRHHRERLKKSRRFHWGRDLLAEPTVMAKAINTPTPCSCWMCGNQRKHVGGTLQERRVMEAFCLRDASLADA